MKITYPFTVPSSCGPETIEMREHDVSVAPCPTWCTGHELHVDEQGQPTRLVHIATGAFWWLRCGDEIDRGLIGVRSAAEIQPNYEDLQPIGARLRSDIVVEIAHMLGGLFTA